ncbi:hypothetical protein EGYY_22960 [Eggerthella sp. YY7918]|nr:hypothetical protein EGYY_22960 [Eggerthella sp. YY7918]
MTKSDSSSGELAVPDSKTELRNVSMLHAQKNAMPTCRTRIVFHTIRMLRFSRAVVKPFPFFADRMVTSV